MMGCRVPFDFSERVPIMRGLVNGWIFDRFLLDTGAPSSCLHNNTASKLGLSVDRGNTVHVDSLQFGKLDVGAVDLRISSFGQNQIDGLLGTREMVQYCVMLDLDRLVCIFAESMNGSSAFSKLEMSNGRPIVLTEYAGNSFRFVVDTGSSANWLFVSGQDKLASIGTVVDEAEKAKAAGGNLAVCRAKVLQDMNIGGRDHREVRFLLATLDQFGGRSAPEDGILSVGALATAGTAVIDFPEGRFLLTKKT